MLKFSNARLKRMDQDYPGILKQIVAFDAAELPRCPHCDDADTADVQVGVVQRAINISAATTKFKLIPNGPKQGDYFCNGCERFFDL